MPTPHEIPTSGSSSRDKDMVLYVYRCSACGYRGEVHLPGDNHDGEEATCSACGTSVTLEWDGGVMLVPGNQTGE